MSLVLDSTQAQAEIDKIQGQVDAQVKEWRTERAVIVHELGQIQQGIGLLVRAIRLTAQATGTVLGPMESALLGLVSSTTSLIVSTAIALAAGSLGILAGVAIGMSAFAYGMELTHTAKLMADFTLLRISMDEIKAKMLLIEARTQFGMRGMFGGL